MSESSITDWNMSMQDIMVIDGARRDAEIILLRLRYDARSALTFVDCLDMIYRVITPITVTTANEGKYKERRAKIDKSFQELTELADKEALAANNYFNSQCKTLGASPQLLKVARELFRELYELKDNIGMGLKKQRQIDLDGAIGRAAK